MLSLRLVRHSHCGCDDAVTQMLLAAGHEKTGGCVVLGFTPCAGLLGTPQEVACEHSYCDGPELLLFVERFHCCQQK